MGETVRRKWWGALAAGVACCLIAGSAPGAVLVQTDFNGGPSLVKKSGGLDKTTGNGKGWSAAKGGSSKDSQGYLSVDLKSAGLNVGKGAFDFTIVRGNQEDDETVFTLLGESDNDPLLQISIGWQAGDTKPYSSQVWL